MEVVDMNGSNGSVLEGARPRMDRSTTEMVPLYLMWLTNITAFIGNSLLLVVFTQKKKLKAHDMLITTLACLDLIHSIVNMVLNVLPREYQSMYPKVACYISHSLFHFITLSSCFTVIEITIDRLLAVCSVLFHRVHATNKRCLLLIACTQVFVVLVISPSAGICIKRE